MKQLDKSVTVQRTDSAAVKHPSVMKDFSALSFQEGGVTAKDSPAPGSSQPRPTPESVQAFNVHDEGTVGDNTSEADIRSVASSGGDSLENLQRRYATPYDMAAPFRHWGINE